MSKKSGEFTQKALTNAHVHSLSKALVEGSGHHPVQRDRRMLLSDRKPMSIESRNGREERDCGNNHADATLLISDSRIIKV